MLHIIGSINNYGMPDKRKMKSTDVLTLSTHIKNFTFGILRLVIVIVQVSEKVMCARSYMCVMLHSVDRLNALSAT